MVQDAENLVTAASGGAPTWFYAKSLSVTPTSLIPSSGIDALFEYLDSADKGTSTWYIIFDLEGGAINDTPKNETSYAHRDNLYWMQAYSINPVGTVSKTMVSFLDGVVNTVGSSLSRTDLGAYPGYIDPYLKNAQQEYWGSNLPRLQEIKARIDPRDLFRNPQSVQLTGKR